MNSKRNAERREEYRYYKEHGICVNCRQEEAAKGRTRCLTCLSKIAEQSRARHSKLTEEELAEKNRIRREKGKALRDYRKANGLCDICGKPAYKHYSKCYEHYIYYKRYEKKRREKKNKGYAELGLCRICGEPPAEGKKYCAEHLKQYREKMQFAEAIRLEKKNERALR